MAFDFGICWMITFIRAQYDWFELKREYNKSKNNPPVSRIDLVKFPYKIFK